MDDLREVAVSRMPGLIALGLQMAVPGSSLMQIQMAAEMMAYNLGPYSTATTIVNEMRAQLHMRGIESIEFPI